jgi:SAM-dependent methyltransferase
MKFIVGLCNICGKLTRFSVDGTNLRETVICGNCRSTNRQRQIANVLTAFFSLVEQRKVKQLGNLERSRSLRIYNTEARGALHEALKQIDGYYCSEYFGPEFKPGELIGDVPHQDLMNLSLPDDSVDVVLSSDVFEHIPFPYKAHSEMFRILRSNGRHIFTVPFYQEEFLDEERASLSKNGQVHFHKEPQYHSDPLRAQGTLVYTIFSLEMLCRLRRIGFATRFYKLYKPGYGILGNNGLVFEAIKLK